MAFMRSSPPLTPLLLLSLAGVSVGAQQTPTIELPPATAQSASSFTRVASIRELRDGSLLVVDRGDEQLFHVRLDKSEPRPLGRKGAGPTEYRGAMALFALAGDSTLMTDSYNFRWTLLAGNTIVGTVAESGELNRLVRSDIAGFDDRGRVAAMLGLQWTAGAPKLRTSADSLLLVVAHRSRPQRDSVARLGGQGGRGFAVTPGKNGGPGRIMAANPLGAEDQALLMTDGTLAIAYVDPYRVDFRLTNGSWVRGKTVAITTPMIDRREQCHALAEMIGKAVPCDPTMAPGWPRVLPPFVVPMQSRPAATLLQDPRGRLVVARTTSAAATHRMYDVFDRGGLRVFSVQLPLSDVIVGFGASAVYVARIDDDELQTIRRIPWRR
jgi:hypothetical protein